MLAKSTLTAVQGSGHWTHMSSKHGHRSITDREKCPPQSFGPAHQRLYPRKWRNDDLELLELTIFSVRSHFKANNAIKSFAGGASSQQLPSGVWESQTPLVGCRVARTHSLRCLQCWIYRMAHKNGATLFYCL